MTDEMKRELDAVKRDTEQLKADTADLRASNRRIASALVRIESKLDGMVTQDAFVAFRSEILARMDRFGKTLDDTRYRWAIHAGKLFEQHKRLAKLEARKA